MALLAAFFVLVTLIFTFEPLFSLILQTRTLPIGTTVYFVKTPQTIENGALTTIADYTQNTLHWDDQVAALFIDNGFVSASFGHSAIRILSRTQPGQIIVSLRRYFAHFNPKEVLTILPDQTSMTEIVIDPSLVPVDHSTVENEDNWSFSQANPQIIIRKNGSISSILINNPQAVDIHGFSAPSSCRRNEEQMKIVTLNTDRQPLIGAVFQGFLPYLRDFSCFQSFSTLSR